MPQFPTSTLQVISSNPRPIGQESQSVAPFPAAPIRVYAMRLEPLRAAGLQAIFARHPGVEIVVEDASVGPEGGWMDPTVNVVALGAQSGAAGTLALIASIRSGRPQLPILVMSPATGDDAILAALHLGVKGFLHEMATAEQFEDAVRVVASGSIWAPRRLLARLFDRLLAERNARSAIQAPRLTRREQQVLDLLREGQSNREIAESLKIDTPTVKVYLARLMRKMRVHNRTALIVRAISSDRQ